MGMDDPPVSPNNQEKYDRILFDNFYHAIHVIYSIGIQHDHSNDCDSLIASRYCFPATTQTSGS